MKRHLLRNLILTTIFLFTIWGPSVGFAGIFVRIDLDSVAVGVQSNDFVSPGATVTASVFMELTDTSNLSSYAFSVRYDTSELSFVSRTESNFGNLAEITQDNNTVDTATGTILNIDGFTLGNGPSAPFGPTRVATLVFTAINPVGTIGDLDITPGLFQSLSDNSFFSNSGANVNGTVTFQGASISAIPEPSTVTFLGLAGLCFSVAARRRQSVRLKKGSAMDLRNLDFFQIDS